VAVTNRRQRAAVAQVAAHDAQVIHLSSKQLCRALHAILVVNTMKAITADSAFSPLVGSWVDRRGIWHLAMKAGVKHRNLPHRSEGLFNKANPFQLNAVVQRSEHRHFFNGRFYAIINHRRLKAFSATVYDAVADDGNFRPIFHHAVRFSGKRSK
jgi:hypothetical protein